MGYFIPGHVWTWVVLISKLVVVVLLLLVIALVIVIVLGIVIVTVIILTCAPFRFSKNYFIHICYYFFFKYYFLCEGFPQWPGAYLQYGLIEFPYLCIKSMCSYNIGL